MNGEAISRTAALEAVHQKCVEWQAIYSAAPKKGTRNHAASKLSAYNEVIDILLNAPTTPQPPPEFILDEVWLDGLITELLQEHYPLGRATSVEGAARTLNARATMFFHLREYMHAILKGIPDGW